MEQRLRILVDKIKEKAGDAIMHHTRIANTDRNVEATVVVCKTKEEAAKIKGNVIWVAIEGVFRRAEDGVFHAVHYFGDLFAHFKPAEHEVEPGAETHLLQENTDATEAAATAPVAATDDGQGTAEEQNTGSTPADDSSATDTKAPEAPAAQDTATEDKPAEATASWNPPSFGN